MLNDKVEFHGKMLSMRAISLEIGISRDTLLKYYEETGDIYEAEKICRDILTQKNGTLIDYNGEMLAIQTIAKKEGIKDAKTLKKYYEQTGDIYKAIEMYERKQQEYEDSKIEYKGERKFLVTIAKDEGVAETTLVRYYKKYGNIDKAVYMAKVKRKRTQKIKLQNSSLGLSDLSIILGIKESELINMLNSGMSIDDIKPFKTFIITE